MTEIIAQTNVQTTKAPKKLSKEQVKANYEKYKNKNHDKLTEKLICDICGKKYTLWNKSRHVRSEEHMAAVAGNPIVKPPKPTRSEQNKIYYKTFKAKHDERLKESVTCDICNTTYSYWNKSRHLRSKPHLDAIQTANV